MEIKTVPISKEQHAALLLQREGHFMDLKAKEIRPASLTKLVSAFANASGGEIYLGIDEFIGANGQQRGWRGFSNEEEANNHIAEIEKMLPLGNHYTATFLSSESASGLVLQVTIFKTPQILKASDGKTYIRRGAQRLPVEGDDALERLRLDKGILSFEDNSMDAEKETVTNSTVIIQFLIDVIPTAEPEAWLIKQRMLKENHPSVSGILLFSEEPQAILPKRSAIKIYRYKTKADEGERDVLAFDPITIEGPIYTLIYSAVEKCRELVEGIKKLGESGLETIKYPPEAIHEFLTNSVLHRDYSIPADVQIRIFDNRIEIESPGKLPGHITVKNILREQFARNPKLVRMINKFPDPPNKDVGEGINTAFEAMEKLRLRPPMIEERDNSVVVTIRHQSLASPEETVMEYLESHAEIRNSIARELTGIKSENTMKNVFIRLKTRNLIEPVPGKKGFASAWQKK